MRQEARSFRPAVPLAAALALFACGDGRSIVDPSPPAAPTSAPAAEPVPVNFLYVAAGADGLLRLTTDAVGKPKPEIERLPGYITAVAVTPAGNIALVSRDGELETHRIDGTTGALEAVAAPPLSQPSGPTQRPHGALWPKSIVFHPSGGLAYVMYSYDTHSCGQDVEGVVYAHAIDGNGMVRRLPTELMVAGRSYYWTPPTAALAGGSSLYTVSAGSIEDPGNCDYASTLRGFNLDADSGRMSVIAPSPLETVGRTSGDNRHFDWVVGDPAGDWVYVGARLTASAVLGYRRDAGTGQLTRVHEMAAASGGLALLSPAGRMYVYSTSIRVFGIDRSTGLLTAGPTVLTPPAAVFMAFDRSGDFAYVVTGQHTSVTPSVDGAMVQAYRVDRASGALTAAGEPVPLPFRDLRGLAVTTAR